MTARRRSARRNALLEFNLQEENGEDDLQHQAAATARHGTRRRFSPISHASASRPAMPAAACIKSCIVPLLSADYTVTCLCAEWCDTCVEYRPGFSRSRRAFREPASAGSTSRNSDEAGDLEWRTSRPSASRAATKCSFHGTLLPMHEHLKRLLEKLLGENP